MSIEINSTVVATRDIHSKNIRMGDRGIVYDIEYVDSKIHFHIKMNNNSYIGSSDDNCWELFKL